MFILLLLIICFYVLVYLYHILVAWAIPWNPIVGHGGQQVSEVYRPPNPQGAGDPKMCIFSSGSYGLKWRKSPICGTLRPPPDPGVGPPTPPPLVRSLPPEPSAGNLTTYSRMYCNQLKLKIYYRFII